MSKQDTWRKTLVSTDVSFRDVVENLNASALQIVLVVSDTNRLIGTISDGDVRRGLLAGFNMSSLIEPIINRAPLTVDRFIKDRDVARMMSEKKIKQIPICDDSGCVVGIHLWDELDRENTEELDNQILVLAGGFGKRLYPHTDSCPKPMLEVRGRPILEHILARAKAQGFVSFVFSLHYLPEVVKQYFGDGSSFGVRIRYVIEDKPLGTAGSLALLQPENDSPIIVTNGDLITDINYSDLLAFHNLHEADATMVVRSHELENPFGVVQTQGIFIKGFEEKPIYRSQINAGVYVVSTKILDLVPKNKAYDMPALFEAARLRGFKTIAYPLYESWIDIGRHEDFEKANKMI